MNTSIKLFGVFGVMLLIGAGCSNASVNEVEQNEPEPSDTIEMETSTFNGALPDALLLGKDLTCTWSSDEGSGTTYISDGRIRTEAITDGESGIILAKDDCTYIWQEGQPDGIEFCQISEALDSFGIDTDAILNDAIENGSEDPYSADPGVDVNCEAKALDEELFNVPSDINFTNPLSSFFNF